MVLKNIIKMLTKSDFDNMKIDDLEMKKSENYDLLEEVKDNIITITRKLRENKRKYDESRGEIREMYADNINRYMNQIKSYRTEREVINGNLNRINIAIKNIREIDATLVKGPTDEYFDTQTSKKEVEFEELENADIAAKESEDVKYEGKKNSYTENDYQNMVGKSNKVDKEKFISDEIYSELEELIGEE